MEKEWKMGEAATNDWIGTTFISGSKQMFMQNNLRNIKEPQNKVITANSNNRNHISIHKQWHKRLHKIRGKKTVLPVQALESGDWNKNWNAEMQINLATLPNYPSPCKSPHISHPHFSGF